LNSKQTVVFRLSSTILLIVLGTKGAELPSKSYFYEMAPQITSLVFEVFSKFAACIFSETVISEYPSCMSGRLG